MNREVTLCERLYAQTKHYFTVDSNFTEQPGSRSSPTLMLHQMVSWHGRGGRVGLGEAGHKDCTLSTGRRRGHGGEGEKGALKTTALSNWTQSL